MNKEQQRLSSHYKGKTNWLKWGPYLSERQWGTVREDYSKYGDPWSYFPHDHARSRVYRWGEDGIAGISDEKQRMCFALAMWNGRDPFLKERLFGVNGDEGSHGEDVKELYYYLDNTPTHSYMKHLYKYPQGEFPYRDLVYTSRSRSKHEGEYKIEETGIFNDGEYFDVYTEYAKASPEDLCIKITITNRANKEAEIWLLPTLWYRNLWSFGIQKNKPELRLTHEHHNIPYVLALHEETGAYHLFFDEADAVLFTENETNTKRLFYIENEYPFVKDSFHDAIVNGDRRMFEKKISGTKCSPVYHLQFSAGEEKEIRLRLVGIEELDNDPLGRSFDKTFNRRLREADRFYNDISGEIEVDLQNIQRQALAGMLWTKQYYHFDVERWMRGDPEHPPPAEERRKGRNKHWKTLKNEDIISMPDKWEYPWYAAWDSAFHCVPLAMVDIEFAKGQLILFLREWYMHPNGQLPAYEWSFSDVNPPVHAWACLQVYKMDLEKNGNDDKGFLKRVFHKLLLNFTWWVNRKDHNENNVFEGGFLGLDNIGVFDRSRYIPGGGLLEQADGTAWMGMYCLNMLEMALILAEDDNTYEDLATKFLEHFVYIAASLNHMGEDWIGAWDEKEGFFYDILVLPDQRFIPLKVRSLVGLTTMFGVLVLEIEKLKKLPDFFNRLKAFRAEREKNQHTLVIEEFVDEKDVLLSFVPKERLERLLHALLDEKEFLGKAGIRSLSKIHEDPYHVNIEGHQYGLKYEPGEGETDLFGGNSNWRGPVWMPMNYMIIQSLRNLHQHYQQLCTIECPTGSGNIKDLDLVANEITQRLISIFQKDHQGRRPIYGNNELFQSDPHFKDLLLFFEFFHGDTAKGLGAPHQTGWTGLVATLIDEMS